MPRYFVVGGPRPSDFITPQGLFARDALGIEEHGGISGISPKMMREYLSYCADQRLVQLGYAKRYLTKNPFPFMVLQDVQPLTNFFEKRVTEYQKGFNIGKQAMTFDDAF